MIIYPGGRAIEIAENWIGLCSWIRFLLTCQRHASHNIFSIFFSEIVSNLLYKTTIISVLKLNNLVNLFIQVFVVDSATIRSKANEPFRLSDIIYFSPGNIDN